MSLFLAVVALLVIAVVILFLLALYFVPVDLKGIIEWKDSLSVQFISTWGAITLEFVKTDVFTISGLLFGHRIFRREMTQIVKEEKIDKIEEKAQVKLADQATLFLNAWPHISGLLSTIYRCIKLREVSCKLKLGFGDPATTGLVYGYFWALRGMLAPFNRLSIELEPVFNSQIFEGKGALAVTINRPAVILIAVLTTFIQKPVRILLFRAGEA